MSNISFLQKTILAISVLLVYNVSYSQKSKAPRSAYDSPSTSAYNEKPAENSKNTITGTSQKAATAAEKKNTKTTSVTSQPNLPIEVVKESPDGDLYGISKPSLRKDDILIDNTHDSTATPLPYTPLYSSDALFRVRVWRVIDARTKKNSAYFYNKSINENDDKRLVNIILKAINEDSVQAFSNVDDRFTTPINFDEVLSSFGAKKDTSAKYDLDGNIIGYQVRTRPVSADSIYKFKVKEEWVFNRRDGKTYVRILGLAPLMSYTTSDGYVMENSEHALFWIYYPDLRKVFIRNSIVNPLTTVGAITWEEVFENRLFESKIVQSSLDAENGFVQYPLSDTQREVIQTQLNNLGKRMWEK